MREEGGEKDGGQGVGAENTQEDDDAQRDGDGGVKCGRGDVECYGGCKGGEEEEGPRVRWEFMGIEDVQVRGI